MPAEDPISTALVAPVAAPEIGAALLSLLT
jgi:hypothetical protein